MFRHYTYIALFLAVAVIGLTLIMGIAQRPDVSSIPLHTPVNKTIPKTWDEDALRASELPLANPDYSPVQVPASFYYQAPERPIYKSYPVYAPGREPNGYWEKLNSTRPEVVWGKDETGVEHRPPLRTTADWVRAGELVFDAAISYSDGPGLFPSLANVRDPKYYEALRPPLSVDGTLAFGAYVIRNQGKVEYGQSSCGMCHTRVLSDGAVIKGAPGNLAFDKTVKYYAAFLKRLPPDEQKATLTRITAATRINYGMPWVQPDPADAYANMTLEKLVRIPKVQLAFDGQR